MTLRPGARLRGPQLYTSEDLAALDSAACLAHAILRELLAMVHEGATPAEIEDACRRRIEQAGATPAMRDIAGPNGEPFGRACAISVGSTVAHARPNTRSLQDGELVTIDLVLALDGWHADVADTVVVGGGGHPLLAALDAAWQSGLAAMRPGGAWATVAAAMDRAARGHDARLVRGLAGHGIGLACHELPALPLTPGPADAPVFLRPGMAFTLEPVVSSGTGETIDSADGWAIETADGAPAAAREAVLVVESEQIRVLGGWGRDDSAAVAGYNPFRTGRGSGE